MNQQERLEHIYGFPFPESFFLFWEFTQRYAPLFALLGMSLVGPFDDFNEGEGHSRWTARDYDDPPEFLTILVGNSDGLHWGYYIDDPHHQNFPVASFYSKGGFRILMSGATIFETVRAELEYCYRDNLEYLEDDPEHQQEYEERLGQLTQLRTALQTYETGERSEEGWEYIEKYPATRYRQCSAPTRDGMGIVVPAGNYLPLHASDPYQNRDYQPSKDKVRRDATKALRLLALGFPGTALKLGKDLWIFREFRETSYALLDAAYVALKRDLLRTWLDKAIAYRQECDARQ